MNSKDVLEQAQMALEREGNAAMNAGSYGEGRAKEISADIVDHVRRVTSLFGDRHYAEEKARVIVRSAVCLWLHTVEGDAGLPELDRVRDELETAIQRAFDAVLDLRSPVGRH